MSTPHSFKRINEFVANGYDVEIYGFTRNQEPPVKSVHDVKIIGDLRTELSYMKRIPIMIKGIKNVLQTHKREDVVYYLFQLDIALAFKMTFCNKRYIYEEPDLMHTYIKNKFIKGLLDIYDKYIIKKSLFAVFTSEGFIKYHFEGNIPIIASIKYKDILPILQDGNSPLFDTNISKTDVQMKAVMKYYSDNDLYPFIYE